MHNMRPPQPHFPDDEFPQPIRSAWWTLIGALVLFPLAGLVLLTVPQPWKAVIVFALVIFFLVLLRRLIQRSRIQRKR